MKKTIALFLCFFAVFALAACGAPKQVPDQTIAWAVEDYLKECGYGTASESSYEAIHSYDDSTKTDTVDIALSAEFPTASISTSCKATYQYDKSSGLWSVIRGGEWTPVLVSSYRLNVTPKNILEVFQETDDANEIDERYGLSYSLWLNPKTEAIEDWSVEGDSSGFAFCKSIDPETAYSVFLKAAYEFVLDEEINKLTTHSAVTGIGDNYHYLKWRDNDYRQNASLICQDSTILLFIGSNDETYSRVMKSIGFFPDMVCEPFDVESDIKEMLYKKADSLLASGYFDSAIEAFTELGDYGDSASRAEEAIEAKKAAEYAAAEDLLEKREFAKAKAAFLALGDYEDSAVRAKEADEAKKEEDYAEATSLFEKEDYDTAIMILHELGDYKDSYILLNEAQKETDYQKAQYYYYYKQYDDALKLFSSLGDYRDCKDIVPKLSSYVEAKNAYKRGDYQKASAIFKELKKEEYLDSEEMYYDSQYQKALVMIRSGDSEGGRLIVENLNTDGKITAEQAKIALDEANRIWAARN